MKKSYKNSDLIKEYFREKHKNISKIKTINEYFSNDFFLFQDQDSK